MGASNAHATNSDSSIQCVEVLIPKSYLSAGNSNLLWTLSVYSLQNQPVRKNREIRNSEIFHFMVYDWDRTIHQLLENSQIPYAIIQFFSSDRIYSDTLSNDIQVPDNEVDFLVAIHELPESGGISPAARLDDLSAFEEQADLFHR